MDIGGIPKSASLIIVPLGRTSEGEKKTVRKLEEEKRSLLFLPRHVDENSCVTRAVIGGVPIHHESTRLRSSWRRGGSCCPQVDSSDARETEGVLREGREVRPSILGNLSKNKFENDVKESWVSREGEPS